jgi:hypothetical protein
MSYENLAIAKSFALAVLPLLIAVFQRSHGWLLTVALLFDSGQNLAAERPQRQANAVLP